LFQKYAFSYILTWRRKAFSLCHVIFVVSPQPFSVSPLVSLACEKMIPVSEAIKIVKVQTHQLAFEEIALQDSLNRVLAEDIFADTDLPPFNRSQMDGYAVRFDDVKDVPARLKIVGESAAGKGWHDEMKTGEAVRIMTGAPVPLGADSVQKVEVTREEDGFVFIDEAVKRGQNIVPRGQEIKSGERVLQKGERITVQMIAPLASFGYAKVKVALRPRVAILATGSELVSVDKKPAQDQIRDSNSFTLAAYAMLTNSVVERLPLADDNLESLKQTIKTASENSDVLILSGGVSVGVYDFTKLALRELGAEIFFEKVSLKPGKPTVFGKLNDTLVFGLPGNPVSVAVTFNLFARMALLLMQGASDVELKHEHAILSRTVKGAKERETYLPATLSTNEKGKLIAEPLKWGGSSDFVSFARTTALINIPQGVKTVEENEVVRVAYLPT
jgi:molybdenum cofactor synthesis domain-containing protein